MPIISKRVISNYLRSECLRRLRLDLVPDRQDHRAEREAQNMPPRDVARPGLRALTDAGREWEIAKVNDLAQAFGLQFLIGTRQTGIDGQHRFTPTPLSHMIQGVVPGTFFIEAEYEIGPTFPIELNLTETVAQYNIEFSALRPDLIQAMPPGSTSEEVRPDGTLIPVQINDMRIPLRIIDIKLTAEPSVPYFIEVTLYAMALSAWLQDQRLNRQFLVSPEASVWPGSHDASVIMTLLNERRLQGQAATTEELLTALDEDLEVCPIRVMVPRLRRFFQSVLPYVLAIDWQQLDWHVDNRCNGCDYLGYPWANQDPNPNHCWTMANVHDHLSRVAFISRGARGALTENQIDSVSSLADTLPSDPAYDSHHTLRATRTVVATRAQALTTQTASVPNQAGTSAVMPAWADLRIYLSADFDIGSGITMAFGISAVWAVSQRQISEGDENYHRWQPQVFPVDRRDVAAEERELLAFLNAINQTMENVSNREVMNLGGNRRQATVQVYIWDNVTYAHLVRVIGRHLHVIIRNRVIARLAWLFPPDSLVANPDISDRECPITIVRDVIRAVVAAPVPHYYSLLNIARNYHSNRTQEPFNQFQTPNLFEDPLSDQIPSERAHEIWSRAGGNRPWNRQLQQLESTVRTKLNALESVAQRLGEDLRGQLNQTAPRIIDLRPPSLLRRAADDARLWFVFARLNVALSELEVQKVHAMPPNEREARFKSAILPRRLFGEAERQALADLNLSNAGYRLVYQLSPGSSEVRAREGDFSFALSPVAQPGFLNQRISTIAQGVQLNMPHWASIQMPLRLITKVTVKNIDRENGIIVLDLYPPLVPVFEALEQANRMDLSQNVIMDPVFKDFFIDRLRSTLDAIGNPPIAIANVHPGVEQAIGRGRAPTRGMPSPVADVYWNSHALFDAGTQRDLPQIKELLEANELTLNQSQWNAWEQALSYRLRLIWGPPGTGKSRTIRAIAVGALHEAAQQGNSLRILIAGPTYESIDNILLGDGGVWSVLMGEGALALPEVAIARLCSASRPPSPNVPENIDVRLNRGNHIVDNLRKRLAQNQGLTIVGSTVHQANELMQRHGGPVQEFFDLILVDEASQMDVAQSTLALAGLAREGSVIVAGDPMQLPPIHQAEKPVGLESMVGPIFSYLKDRFELNPEMLETNYRSCREIVELGYEAGYPRSLHAFSNDLKIEFMTPLPNNDMPPPNWPQDLYWTTEWASILNPDQKAVCLVYREGRSSQWNIFEADVIASLVWLLHDRLSNQLSNELDPVTGEFIPSNAQPYTHEEFWSRGVGIVTPHRAQQALVVSRLQSKFPGNAGDGIRGAVDTVERFQGQQRDIMLATFALGDPDAIGYEDAFLMSLNRFNVMASRARAKLVVLVTQEIVDHLSSDMVVLRESALLKNFAEVFCNQSRRIELGYYRQEQFIPVSGEFRWRS